MFCDFKLYEFRRFITDYDQAKKQFNLSTLARALAILWRNSQYKDGRSKSFEKSVGLADSEAEKSIVERLPLQIWQLVGVR